MAPPFPFVVGVPRSGTTLLRLMLDSHPDLAVPPESYFVLGLLERRRRYERRGGFDVDGFRADASRSMPTAWGVDPAPLQERLREMRPRGLADALRCLYAAYAEGCGKRRYGDKTPVFVRHLERFGALLDEARFLHIVRDGRDVALSLLGTRWGPTTVQEAAALWGRLVREGREAGRRLGPERYLEVRYEALTEAPAATLRRVCSFVELPYRPEMLRYHERAAEQLRGGVRGITASLSKPPTPGLRNWRRDLEPRDLAAFEAVAGSELEAFGYERAAPLPGVGARVRAGAAIATERLRTGRHAVRTGLEGLIAGWRIR